MFGKTKVTLYHITAGEPIDHLTIFPTSVSDSASLSRVPYSSCHFLLKGGPA
jgi:uncharacterized membrane protein